MLSAASVQDVCHSPRGTEGKPGLSHLFSLSWQSLLLECISLECTAASGPDSCTCVGILPYHRGSGGHTYLGPSPQRATQAVFSDYCNGDSAKNTLRPNKAAHRAIFGGRPDTCQVLITTSTSQVTFTR